MNILPSFEWKPGATGIFDGVSSANYHKVSSGLSRSIAQKIVFKSRAHALEDMMHPKPATDAMEIGTLVHCGVLEEHKLASSYVVRPLVNPADSNDRWHGNKNWCKAFNAANAHTTVLSQEDERNVLGCIKALKEINDIGQMLAVGHAELSIFVPYQKIILKCRPDLIAKSPDGKTWIVDIKKCQSATLRDFRSDCFSQHRDFQEAWYRRVLEIAGIPVDYFVFVAVEELPPHGTGRFEISKSDTNDMKPFVQQAIDEYIQCLENGKWPGYTENIQLVEMRYGKPVKP